MIAEFFLCLIGSLISSLMVSYVLCLVVAKKHLFVRGEIRMRVDVLSAKDVQSFCFFFFSFSSKHSSFFRTMCAVEYNVCSDP